MAYNDIITKEISVYDDKLFVGVKHPDTLREFIGNMRDKTYVIEIKEKVNKRSLDSNSYAWLIITKIADVINSSKEEVYLQKLIDYGQSDKIIIKADAYESIKRSYKYLTIENKFTKNNIEWLEVIIHHGSSTYSSKEMSVFLNGVVEDAKEIGIDTATPSQIEEYNRLWEEYTNG